MRILRRLSIAAFLSTLLLSAPGRAAGEPTPAGSATPVETLAEEFGRGAEEVTARLKDVERSLADVAAVEELESLVATYTRRTATHWRETSRLLARNLRTSALDSLTSSWEALHNDLDDVDARIAARVKHRDAERAAIQALHDSWSQVLETAREAQAPAAVVDHVQSTIAAIDRAAPRIEQRRARLLVMQNAVARAYQHCADALARIGEARSLALGRMLTPQEPPLWRAVTDPAAMAWSGAAFEADLATRLDTVRTYVNAYRERLLFSVAVIVLLIVLLRWVSRRLAALDASGRSAARPVAFRTPAASAFLVGLLLTVPLRPTPPYEFQQLTLLLLLAASMLVFRPIVSPRIRAGLLAACAVFALSQVVQLLEPAPRVEQILLVVETTAMAALLVWGTRQIRSEAGEGSFLQTAMLGVAVLSVLGCGLSAVAAASGYLDLADMLGVGLLLALLLYLLVQKTRLGALVRAGASNREMATAMGVDIKRLFTRVFGFGAALCALAGAMLGPILAVQVGMGEEVLILAFVVIVIGGIGSIRGALVGALLVGMVDTLGRTFIPVILRAFLPPMVASNAGPALASILIYLLMAAVLFWRPQGLFPARG